MNQTERSARLEAATVRFPYYGATGQVGEIDGFLFDGEAVLLGEDGAPFLEPAKRKAYVVSGKYWVNNHAHVLRARQPHSNAFICHQLNWTRYEKFVSGTTRLKLTQASMLEIPLFVPPPEEQQRIVSRIDQLFSEIDEGERALVRAQKLVDRYRQFVLKAAVSGELTRDWRERHVSPTESEHESANKLPQGWSRALLGSLSSKVTSGSRDWKRYYGRGDGIFIMAQNVRPGRLDLSEVQLVDPPIDTNDAVRSQVEESDLLVTIVGANTGDVCRVDRPMPRHYVCQSVALVRLADVRHAPFIELFLISDEGGQAQFAKTIYGAGRPHLSFDQLRAIEVPLPPLGEQMLIVDAVRRADSQLQGVIQALAAARQRGSMLRDSVLSAAFFGHPLTQDLNDPDGAPMACLSTQVDDAPAAPSPRRRRSAVAGTAA